MSSSFFRGQRFHINLDSDSASDSSSDNGHDNGNGSGNEDYEKPKHKPKHKHKHKHTDTSQKTKSKTTDTVEKTEALSHRDTVARSDESSNGKSSTNKNNKNTKKKQSGTSTPPASQPSQMMPMSVSLIADVCERRPPSGLTVEGRGAVPLPPDLKKGITAAGGSLATGFPAHRKRGRGSGLGPGLGSGSGSGSGSVFRNGGGIGERKSQREEREQEQGRVDRDRLGMGENVTTGTGQGPDLSTMKNQRLRRDPLVGEQMDTKNGIGGEEHVSATNRSRGQRSNSIDRENRAKLAAMTPAEIERERDELMAQLSPALVERLMKRVNIDHRQGDGGIDGLNGDGAEFPGLQRGTGMRLPQEQHKIQDIKGQRGEDTPNNTTIAPDTNPSKKTVSFASPPPSSPSPSSTNPNRPPSPRTLRRLYFPDQPPPDAIPALSWTLPVSSSSSSPAKNNKTSLSISALRFSLDGTLIPPSVATSLPVTLGLHHHAANPDAAGYTISELTRLSRSAVPAQRCVAIKALGGVARWMAKQMEIEKVGREDETDDDDDDGNKTENGNAAKYETGTEDPKDADRDGDDRDKEEDGHNPRVVLLKGLWTLAKEERVLDILRFETGIDDGADADDGDGDGDGEQQQQQQQQRKQEQEQDQKSHLHRHHHHHQSVRVYAEDALSAWRVVERQMRVRRAV